jgi:cellulose synthase/poly-beta-1,6-N-acetylglucosamine synthase-like glycosyltransferase
MQQLLLIFLIVLLLIYCLLIVYYYQSWKSIADFRFPIIDFNPATKLSIIIPARNEEENIKACLQSIIAQGYPKILCEVIVVDDHSTDDTAAVVRAFGLPFIKLVSLSNFVAANEINSYKKKAIEIAIAQSSGDLIITTDADCIVPPNWLITIAAFYESTKAKFIVMPVAIHYRNRFIEIFQSLDFMTLQGITAAAVHKKMHSMCNGANLAYTKKAYQEASGFTGIDTIASGDDMLLMHKIFKQYPGAVFFLHSKEVIVQTNPVTSIKAFFNQRIRWASKADKYDDKRITAVLVLVYLFNCALLVLPIIAVFNNVQYLLFNIQCSMFSVWLWLVCIKTIVELIFLYPVAKFFNQQKLLWLFPLMEPFHIVYTVIAGWLGKFGSYKWKDRNVK